MGDTDWIDGLSTEVLENILTHIPLMDLIQSCSLVCRRWYNIIIASTNGTENKFLHHRKRYYRYKLNHQETTTLLLKEVSSINGPKDCIPWLLSHLHGQPELHINARLYTNKTSNEVLFSAIEEHSRYPLALSILQERFPALCTPVSYPGIVAVICMTARNVHDIREIFKVAVSHRSPCVSLEITELIGQIATYSLVFSRKGWCPTRVHYLLYYGLYLYVNDWCYDASIAFTPCAASDRPDERASVSLTAEQRRIIHHDLVSMLREPPATVKIAAYAGTGKTTTLVELCRRNPKIRFLLVVFNRSVAEHSRRVFPGNVNVRTVNSLSWAFVKQVHQGHFQKYRLKYEDLINYNYITTGFPGFSLYHRAAMTMDTLDRFYNSDSQEIGVKHTPTSWCRVRGEMWKQSDEALKPFIRNRLVADAKDIWEKIRTRCNTKMQFDYNSSMKEFQLSDPNLQDWGGKHDVLLIDEAQDMNPACLDICLKQKTPRIVVGDSHQQIYSFRGAINALSVIDTHPNGNLKQTYYLTQSFRFGAEIAFVAQSCLSSLQRVEGPILVGSKKKDSVTTIVKKPGVQKIAILGRTNLGLFEEMVTLVCEVDDDKRPAIAFPVDITGNADPIGFQQILNLEHFRAGNMHLISGNGAHNPNFRKGWERFKASKIEGQDKETLAKILIVEKYKEKIPEYINILEEQSQPYNFHHPDVNYIFSTVHKFKGLECDTVRLLDDFFISYHLPFQQPQEQEDDDFNLVYVALTRAKKNLVLNDTLFFLMTSKYVNHNFETVEASIDCVEDTCALCRKPMANLLKPKAGLMKRQSVRVRRSFQRKGGSLCCLCSGMPFRFVNYKLSRKLTEVSMDRQHGTRTYHGICPGILKDLYHLFMIPLVGPSNSEYGIASSYFRELEDVHEDDDGIWNEVGCLRIDDLSDPSKIDKEQIQDLVEKDDAEALKPMKDEENDEKSLNYPTDDLSTKKRKIGREDDKVIVISSNSDEDDDLEHPRKPANIRVNRRWREHLADAPAKGHEAELSSGSGDRPAGGSGTSGANGRVRGGGEHSIIMAPFASQSKSSQAPVPANNPNRRLRVIIQPSQKNKKQIFDSDSD